MLVSGKKTTKKSAATGAKRAPIEKEDVPRRPKTLGIIALIAGGISTWYWYKPLPPEQKAGVYNDWTLAEDEGLWGETDLIRPSLDSLEAELSSSEQTTEGLVEDSKKLIPVPVYRRKLTELIQDETIPTLPSVDSLNAVVTQPPQVWTNSIDGAAPGMGGNSAIASGTTPNGSRSLDWPDQGYDPSKQTNAPTLASSEPNSNAPALLHTSSAPRSIRTTENSYTSPQSITETAFSAPIEHRTFSPAKQPDPPVETPRVPQVIRQPKR